jgi:hypothetical protein
MSNRVCNRSSNHTRIQISGGFLRGDIQGGAYFIYQCQLAALSDFTWACAVLIHAQAAERRAIILPWNVGRWKDGSRRWTKLTLVDTIRARHPVATFWECPIRTCELQCEEYCTTDRIIINRHFTLLSHWRVLASGIWRRVVRWESRDDSKEHVASIFRAED